jgi:hypothetical protein
LSIALSPDPKKIAPHSLRYPIYEFPKRARFSYPCPSKAAIISVGKKQLT